MELINSWQFNLCLYYIFVVFYFQFYKLAVQHTKKDGAATIILQLIAGLSILVLVPFFSISLPTSQWFIPLIALACVFYAINDRLQTTVRKHLEVSAFSVLSQLGVVFLLIYGFTLFGEPFTIQKIVGAGLILGANIWLFYKPKVKTKLNKEFKYFLLGTIALFAFATAATIDISIADTLNLPLYISITLLIPALMVAGSERIRLDVVTKEWQKSNKKYYLITGFTWALTILFSLRAFQAGEVSVVAPLQSAAIIVNVIVAYIFQHERSDLPKKLLAALIVVLGVYLTVQ